jgi:glutamate-1-semialdehyde 2,1-aminomutase
MTAGIETLKLLAQPGVYKTLEKLSADLEQGLRAAAAEAGVPVTFNRVGSMFTGFFTGQKVKDFGSAKTSDTARFGRFFLSMLKNGVNLAPSQFEAAFMSLAHSKGDIAKTVEAARKSLKGL